MSSKDGVIGSIRGNKLTLITDVNGKRMAFQAKRIGAKTWGAFGQLTVKDAREIIRDNARE